VTSATNGVGYDNRIALTLTNALNAPGGGPYDDLLVFEIVALLVDHPDNVDGRLLTNTATLDYGNGVLTDTAQVEVVEPVLTIDKTGDPLTGDAGDTITYTITVRNEAPSTAAAFELEIT